MVSLAEPYLYAPGDARNSHFLPTEHPGHNPKLHEHVYIRNLDQGSGHDIVVCGVYMDTLRGNRRTPVAYEVLDIAPARDVEVTGGTMHVGTRYLLRDTRMSTYIPKLVPAFRIVGKDHYDSLVIGNLFPPSVEPGSR